MLTVFPHLSRLVRPIALMAIPLSLVVACQSGSSDTSSSSESAGPSASTSVSVGPTASDQQSSQQATTTRCSSSQLEVTTAEAPEGSAAGHTAIAIVFTNISDNPCTIYGYPGVSFVTGESGEQVNDAATRRTSETPSTVTLASTGTAQATLLMSQPDFYDEADCQPTDVPGLRVYPPDETASIFVSISLTVCSAQGTGVPEIGPVTARS